MHDTQGSEVNGQAHSHTEMRPTVPYPSWDSAFVRVLASLIAGPGLVLVTGPAGTGKTLLLQEVHRALQEAGWVARLASGANMSDEEVPYRAEETVLIDEAEWLDPVQLERLLRRVGRLILAGVSLPGAEGLPGLRTIVHLGPLQPAEVMPFLAARLVQAGQPSNLFSSEAIQRLAFHSEGLPGRVTELADISVALIDRGDRVSADHVETAMFARAFESVITKHSNALVPEEIVLPSPAVEASTSAAPATPPSKMADQPPRRRGRALATLGVVACSAAVIGMAAWQLSENEPFAPFLFHPFAAAPAVRPMVPPADRPEPDAATVPVPLARAAVPVAPVAPDPAPQGEMAQALAPPPAPPSDTPGPQQPTGQPEVAGASPAASSEQQDDTSSTSLPASLPAEHAEAPPPLAPDMAVPAPAEASQPPVAESDLPVEPRPATVLIPGTAALGVPTAPTDPVQDEERPRRSTSVQRDKPQQPVRNTARRVVSGRSGERDLSAGEERCKNILLRTQIGERPSSAELSFLRNGCRPS